MNNAVYGSSLPQIDPFATHIRVVATTAARCAALYPGMPMLELGAGNYSTPVIHAIAPAHVLVESNAEWAAQFSYAKPVHAKWLQYRNQTPHLEYSFALLDNEELVINRIKHIPELLRLAHVVAMHDVRNNALPSAEFNYVDKQYTPWTWVGSNEIDVAAWFR